MLVEAQRYNLIYLNIQDTIRVYHEEGDCGPDGDDHLMHFCGGIKGVCPQKIHTDLCVSGEAELTEFQEPFYQGSSDCWYHWYAEYLCKSKL